MTSREERKETLKTIREGGIARNVSEAYVLLLHCIGVRPQLPAVNTYELTLERLADLIDPTCHVTDEEVTHEPTLNALAVHVYECDKCGWYFYMAEVCCHPKPFYCPMCGARVVRDEA